eukprot:4520173-Heterocapsa_arctica.AAC.1
MHKASSAILEPVAKFLESLHGEIKQHAADMACCSDLAAWFDEDMHLKTCIEHGMTNAYLGVNYVPVE